VLPALIATGAWGFVTGIALVKSGLSETAATLMTVMVYSGTAQLTALPLIISGAPLWLIFAAAVVVNIRFIIFGAALYPYFRYMRWQRRLLLSYFTSDIVFAVFIPRYVDSRKKGTRDQLWFYLGGIIPVWLVWEVFSLLGIYMGSFVPASWSLDFAAILAILAIIIPLVRTRPMLVSLLVAGFVAWVGQPLPLRLGLAAAVVAGIVTGVVAERWNGRRAEHG